MKQIPKKGHLPTPEEAPKKSEMGFQPKSTIAKPMQGRFVLALQGPLGDFHSHGASTIAGWFRLENPNLKWIMTRGTPMTLEISTCFAAKRHSQDIPFIIPQRCSFLQDATQQVCGLLVLPDFSSGTERYHCGITTKNWTC